MRTNIPRVAGKIAQLPKKFEAAAEDIGKEWAFSVKRGAKAILSRKISKKYSRELIRGIDVRQLGRGTKTFEIGVYGRANRYARYIERGFKPHRIPLDYIDQHMNNPGQKGKYVKPLKSYILNAQGEKVYYIMVSGKPRPFLRPALVNSMNRLPEIFKRGMKAHMR